jgi:hypothetical protein
VNNYTLSQIQKWTVAALLGVDLLLILLHLTGNYAFNLDYEWTLLSFYQSAKLVGVGWLSWSLGKEYSSKIFYLLSLMFVYLGLDEFFQIHEFISDRFHQYLLTIQRSEDFAAWLVPYTPLIVFGLLCLYLGYKLIVAKSNAQLRVKLWYLLGIACFGLVPLIELLGTEGWNLIGDPYLFSVAMEEGLEMLGVSAFTIAFLSLKLNYESLSHRFSIPSQSPTYSSNSGITPTHSKIPTRFS